MEKKSDNRRFQNLAVPINNMQDPLPSKLAISDFCSKELHTLKFKRKGRWEEGPHF